MKLKNLLYYSTNTVLANFINNNYYKGNHYVWCSPVFNPKVLNKYDPLFKIPPTSSPYRIYHTFLEEVEAEDRHSPKIATTKIGLKEGAKIHLKRGTITKDDFDTINELIDNASFKSFRPLLYVIPKTFIRHKIIKVPVTDTANPLGVEYQIQDLKNNEFEMHELI